MIFLQPDNILVSHDFSKVVLCDFGSAIDGDESVEMITPYLVSRFYRAPEVILGLIPSYAIDLWSLAVTVAELFLGKVLFKGMNNNDMLNEMMLHMGPISNRLIRQHLVQTKKFPLLGLKVLKQMQLAGLRFLLSFGKKIHNNNCV